MSANKRDFTIKDNKVKVIRECTKDQGLETTVKKEKKELI